MILCVRLGVFEWKGRYGLAGGVADYSYDKGGPWPPHFFYIYIILNILLKIKIY